MRNLNSSLLCKTSFDLFSHTSTGKSLFFYTHISFHRNWSDFSQALSKARDTKQINVSEVIIYQKTLSATTVTMGLKADLKKHCHFNYIHSISLHLHKMQHHCLRQCYTCECLTLFLPALGRISPYMSISCGHVVRDFESEAKTWCNF